MMHRRPLVCWLAVAALSAAAGAGAAAARAAEVQVAVAANMAAPMARIAAAFAQDTAHRAVLSPGSTGKLYAQIRNGAPFHVLLSADQATPERLEREGQTVPGSRFTYATGRLVLWSAQPGLVDAQGAVLRTGNFQKLALADPRLAPYGAAAYEVLNKMGLLPALQARIVTGESVGTAFQWVRTGNAQLGFVALSQVSIDGRIAEGSAWRVPAELHGPLRQDAVALKGSEGNPAASALLTYLQGDKARGIMRSYGYDF